MRGLTLSLGLMFALALQSSPARACMVWSPQPVRIWMDQVQIDVNDQIASKTFNITFKNPNPYATTGGTCYLEVEPGAQVQQMAVLVDGVEMPAEVLDADKAKQVFQDLVKAGGSPALLESYGFQLIQTSLPKISVNGTATIRVKYTTVLKPQGGMVRLHIPGSHSKGPAEPLNSASVTVNLRSRTPLKNVYSPTHEIKLVEKEGWDVSVEWKKENYVARHPFVMYYQIADEQIAASLLSHRELDEDGTFMLMLSPTLGQGSGKVEDGQILPKDVVFCADTSGSMLQGGKMEQARAALKYCVEHLREGDRFNIVDFSSTVRQLKENGLIALDDASREQGLKYVADLNARGGTAINEALLKSIELLKPAGAEQNADGSRLKMIVFATDGLPTMGERDPQAILRNVSKSNTDDIRIFVFGEGFDVNTQLLDFLALDHRGEADYILPEENITEKIGRFFDRVGSPIMTDVQIDFAGLEVEGVHPQRIPDLFRGEQIILYGRYRGFGEKTVKVSGKVAGELRTLEYTLNFPEYTEDDAHSFVPRLWAGKRVDSLLNEIRKASSPDSSATVQGNPQPIQKLVDEVTYLAKRYGIVTPYTSYLLADNTASDAPAPPQFGRPEPGPIVPLLKGVPEQQQMLRRLQAAQAPAGNLEANAEQVRDAKALANARRGSEKSGGAAAFDALADRAVVGGGDGKPGEAAAASPSAGAAAAVLRTIGSRTFYLRNGVWEESGFVDGKDALAATILIGSDEYFTFLAGNPRQARYLSLGGVVLQIDGKWYRFEAPEENKLKK